MTRVLTVVVAAVMLAASAAVAQEGGRDLFMLGGEAGTFSELYGISGAEQRRPTTTGRLYLRPTLSFYGLFNVGVDVVLSTEGSSFQGRARQSINQYSISPDWGWGNATLGDFTGSYTPLTYSGIRARGARAEVSGGPLTFSLFGGRAQRATPGGISTGGYSRNIVGGRLGVGDPDATSLGLVVLKARDDPNSLPPPADTTFLEQEPDTAFVEDTLSVGMGNQFGVTPQENLVVGLAGGVSLLDARVVLRGELAGSGYTRDLRSDEIDSPELLNRIPGIAQTLFTPRVSSSADYAYTLEARVRPWQPLTTTVTFRNLGPGYVSLGTASLLSDRREIQARSSFRLRRVRASVDLARQHDNLADQKSFTTQRDRLSTMLSVRMTGAWTTSLRLQRATLDNAAPEPEQRVDYGNWLAGSRQTITFGRKSTVRTASVDYTYRTTGDANPLRVSSTSRSHSVNLSVTVAPSRVVSVTPTVGVVRARFAEEGWSTRSTYGIGSQLALFKGRWVSGLNLSRASLQQTVALQAMLTTRYQVTQSDALIFSVRASDYDNVVDETRSFREAMMNLRWAHRF